MGAHRLETDAEPGTDLLVRQAEGQQREDLELPRGQSPGDWGVADRQLPDPLGAAGLADSDRERPRRPASAHEAHRAEIEPQRSAGDVHDNGADKTMRVAEHRARVLADQGLAAPLRALRSSPRPGGSRCTDAHRPSSSSILEQPFAQAAADPPERRAVTGPTSAPAGRSASGASISTGWATAPAGRADGERDDAGRAHGASPAKVGW